MSTTTVKGMPPVTPEIEDEPTEADKIAAVALLEIYGGRLKLASAMSGCTEEELKTWRAEYIRTRVGKSMRTRIAERLEVVQTLALARIVQRSKLATQRELNATVGIFTERITQILRDEFIEAQPPKEPKEVKGRKAKGAAEQETKPAEPVKVAIDDEAREALDLVESIMREAEASGTPLSRNEVVDGMCAQRPELAKYLRPVGAPIEDEDGLTM